MASKNMNESGKVTLRKIYYSITVIYKLLKEILRNKPDLCYIALTTTGAALIRDLIIISLLRILNIKRVYHLHNKGVYTNSKNAIKRTIYKSIFKDAYTILLSKNLYQDISDYIDFKKVFICPNGIKEFCPPVSKGSGTIPNILFLSNLIEAKGVYILIEACKVLAQKNIAFTCTLAGAEGDVTKKILDRMIQKHGLSDKIEYVGLKVGEEKSELFLTADIFTLPTYYSSECFPLVLLEAMQSKLPIISTYEGGIPDIIDDGITGFLVPQKNVDLLAQKLELLINNESLRTEMGEAGLEKYKGSFTFDTFESSLSKILTLLSK
ncbi:glycosyltransferase family 4 protein [Saccharicrinis sp. FJH62]|uniref:glycosyltransferase family 4 protein n=1 Tax=Saccharicrinis sp. FJH62 TaxID=3344657 RepID=UPI0035D4A99A